MTQCFTSTPIRRVEAVEWIVFGFLLMHLVLLVGIVAGLFYAHFGRGRRSKGGGDREKHTAHSMR